jgi:ubiquinol-cytochrome c reductase core subunit 2
VRFRAPTNEHPPISISFLTHTLPPSSPMLRPSTTAVRNSTRLARSFATVVDSASGVKVAAVDNGQPTSAVTFLVKAGSRFENKPGVAHALKNFAFKV